MRHIKKLIKFIYLKPPLILYTFINFGQAPSIDSARLLQSTFKSDRLSLTFNYDGSLKDQLSSAGTCLTH
jgi:hypothetical protein